MSILTIIPARSGSKRLPGKNLAAVNGKTLVEWACQVATNAGCPPSIVTDTPEHYRHIAGASVAREPDELAGDDVPMGKVVEWTCRQCMKEHSGAHTKTVLLLQPTSPFRTIADISRCRDILAYGCDSVVSVTYDLATKGYRRNGAIYLTRWELAARGELMGGWTQFYVMPPERSIDINTAEDLAEARRIAGDS